MSNGLPPPTPTPPSIEQAVREHLEVVHEIHELRRVTDTLAGQQAATAKAVTSLAGDIGRLADGRTADSLTLSRIERRFMTLEQKVDGLALNMVKLLHHLGASLG